MLIGIDANEANIKNRVGINMYAFHLLHALHKNTTHKFIIYLKNQPLSDLPKERANWVYRVLPFPKLWTQTRLPFDLYFHQPRPDVFLSLTHYGPRFCPIPNVISIMDLGFLSFPDQFTSKDLNQLKLWTAYSVKNATKILAISEFTKNDIVKYYHRDPKDIYLTYLGYDQNTFYPHTDNIVLNKYGITKPYILFVSSLKPSKNVEGLIKAFKMLLTSPPAPLLSLGEGNKRGEVQLVISGKKAWMYDQIFKLVKDLKLEKQVIFTDYLPDADVPVLMSQAACFVLPSFHEGFALPAIEAMACGTPVVVSNVANLPEIAGDSVIYVDPHSPSSIADGILMAIKNRQKYIKSGLKRVKSFSWANCAQQTLICLENAVSFKK